MLGIPDNFLFSKMRPFLNTLIDLPIEALIWVMALVLLAISSPTHAHFTVCPLALAGLDWCPGCGLGRSVIYLFDGEFAKSWQEHPLGGLAVIVLSVRIVNLTKLYIIHYGKSYRRTS